MCHERVEGAWHPCTRSGYRPECSGIGSASPSASWRRSVGEDGRARLVLVPKVGEDLDAILEQRPQSSRELAERLFVVGRMAEAEVAERRFGVPVVDADGGSDIGARPALVAEVERQPEVGRAEQQLEQPVVARRLDDRADRAEPLAESADTFLEGGDRAESALWQLDREAKASRRLPRPASELLLRRGADSPWCSARPKAGARHRSAGTRHSEFLPGRSLGASWDTTILTFRPTGGPQWSP